MILPNYLRIYFVTLKHVLLLYKERKEHNLIRKCLSHLFSLLYIYNQVGDIYTLYIHILYICKFHLVFDEKFVTRSVVIYVEAYKCVCVCKPFSL